MNRVFVTFLATDSFLAGTLALHQSLTRYNKNYRLLVLYTNDVSDESLMLLENKRIILKAIKLIRNPHHLGKDERGFGYVFSKLRIFELVEYEKLVYIDSDMLVCADIESLFDKPHMSAVQAGSLLPENFSWHNLNSGLMAVEPSLKLAEEIYNAVEKLSSGDCGDQGFLHSFYPEWPARQDLHLDQIYNVPSTYLDRYCDEFDFSFSYLQRKLRTNVAVLHFWGMTKPWHFNVQTFSRRDSSKLAQAIVLWWDVFGQSIIDW